MAIAQFARQHGLSRSAVHRAVASGHLTVDERVTPMLITGDLPIGLTRYRNLVRPALAAARPGTIGFDGDGVLHVLKGDVVKRVLPTNRLSDIPAKRREITAILEAP